ncbi:putative heavy metal-associated domain, HMA, heavy metal-associated domain superfamily [Helianthus annuus]|nr:putative heavy metal-associated domain, HMA, heavy metal-associated domain superfamily [Helianthus annuus]
MVQRTVLKVRLSCEKCRKKILKSVSGLYGVDKIEIDAAKDTLTVTGDADPYVIIKQARKVIKCVEVVTIGPPPQPPKKPEEKKSVDKKPEVTIHPFIHIPQSCVACNSWSSFK